MKTLFQRPLALILLGSALLLLPACGSQNVKSQNQAETVLNTEETPPSPSSGLSEGHKPARSYIAKIHRTKGAQNTTITTTPVSGEGATMASTLPGTPKQTPALETPMPVKKSAGAHWFLWLLVLIVLGLIGWYFWSKNQEGQHPGQPAPPLGGLSPVSGFTAVKDRIEEEDGSKPSFWNKKLF